MLINIASPLSIDQRIEKAAAATVLNLSVQGEGVRDEWRGKQ